MSFVPVNPRPFLQDLVNKDVVVRLKWGETEYEGKMVSFDGYMNIELSNTKEYINREFTGALGQVLIRCNNVLYVMAAKGGTGEGGDRDTKMEG